jgi:type IV pilus assembly protein PilC
MRAGESIGGAVLGLGRSTRNNLLREALTDVAVELRREGARPAAAFAARADVFPPAFLNILRVGAKKGDISDVLAKYGEAQLRAAENISRCRGALYYPATIGVLASIILALMCYFILPKMEEFYAALLPLSKGDLPLLTRGLLGLSRTLTSVPGLLATGLAVALAVYFVRWARNDGREAIERASLRWPGVGPLARTFHAAQAVHLVAILVGAGVTPHEFLKEAASSSINIVYRETLEAIREAFHVGGLDLQTAFAPYAFLFGDEFQGAVATGEKTGRLETQLAAYANLLDARVQESVTRLSKLVEPLTLVAAGLVIGLIVIAAYLPLFTLIGQLSNAK